MWGVRKQVSLLLDHGHPHAQRYPISMVWEEAELVVERVNSHTTTQAALMQLAVASGMGGKKAAAEFTKLLKRLNSDG